MNLKFKVIALRFLRVFVLAGLAEVVLLLQNPEAPLDVALLRAFLIGGLAAVEKLIRWQEAP
mgnify:FL=1